MKTILVALLLVLSGVSAKAGEAYTCGLTFEAEGGGFKFIVGHYQLSGTGMLNCINVSGDKRSIPVNVTLGGAPYSIEFAAGHAKLHGAAANVSVGNPDAVLGEYAVLTAGAFLADGIVGLRAANGVTMNVEFGFEPGWHAELGLTSLTIAAQPQQ